jgi:hypothetical protein
MAKQKTDAEIAAAAARESLRLIEQEAKIRERMNSSYDEYIKAAKEARVLQETLNRTTKLQEEIDKRIKAVKAGTLSMTKEELAAEEAKLEYLKKQNDLMGKQVALYKSAAKEANVGAMALGKATASLAKSFSKFPNLIQSSFGKIKGLGIFEMDKAMKQTALSMGVLSKESVGMRATITNVAKQTTMIGVGLAKVAKLQEDYSYNLGRNVLMSEKGLKAMAEMSVVTGLGAEGTAQMAADMDVIGLSAERTGEFVEGTMKNSSKMGLNASKVMKNLAGNFKMLNRYNFKEGAKGLASMAQTVTKLGVDMETAAGFADKLWNIEGAVEMSAQLNVMGGEWAAMADPFHLMYMARNDMEGLTKEIANAAKQSVMFNKETGEFDMSAEGMHKLKIIAEQTGLAYDDLVTMGKNAKKFEKIESQITFGVGGGKEGQQIKDYLTSKSYMNKNGDATIMLNGHPKLVKTLNESDKTLIKAQIKQEEDMEERAKQARTFDETLSYFIDNLKVSLLPMLEGLNKMIPKLDEFVKHFNDKGGWGEKLEAIAKWVGDLVGALGSWVIDNPIKSGLAVITAKLLPGIVSIGKMMWDTAKWFTNGMMLGKGFNAVASAGGGGGGSDGSGGGGGGAGKGWGKNFKSNYKGLRAMGDTRIGAAKSAFKWGGGTKGMMKGGLKSLKGLKGLGGVANLAMLGYDAYSDYNANKEAGMGTGENVTKTATSTAGKGLGTWGGAAAGAAIGSVVPVVGTLLGGLIGGALGYFAGDKVSSGVNNMWGKKTHDGVFNAPVNDGHFAGAAGKGSASKMAGFMKPGIGAGMAALLNPALGAAMMLKDVMSTRGVVQGGKITPIDGQDDLVAYKKHGVIDKDMKKNSGGGKTSGTITHKFEKIDISGTINLELPGNVSHKIDFKDASTQSKLTKAVQEGVIRHLGMGKLK